MKLIVVLSSLLILTQANASEEMICKCEKPQKKVSVREREPEEIPRIIYDEDVVDIKTPEQQYLEDLERRVDEREREISIERAKLDLEKQNDED